MKKKKSLLLPERHPTRDFFTCDILDPSFKDDLASMEHPIFSLATKPDVSVRLYKHNGNELEVIPSILGVATIWDKDILIYCISQIVEGHNRGRTDISKTVRMTVYDYLRTTNKSTAGSIYERLPASLDRLAGTRVKTNIKTNGERIKEGFGLIDKWKVVEKSSSDEKMTAIEITLSDWLYNAAKGNDVLTLDRDYFRLRKGLERRIYELARKHCGNQKKWKIRLKLLHKKSGSKSTIKEFRRNIKEIISCNHLPGYRVYFINDRDLVVFYSRNGNDELIKDVIQGALF
ncbi:MAG: replication initiator protein A [Cocleimonas sp.]|nr:replication initiator protein A [Cocleimonas sp.]